MRRFSGIKNILLKVSYLYFYINFTKASYRFLYPLFRHIFRFWVIILLENTNNFHIGYVEITLETGYYPGARHTPRGINFVMIALGAGKLATLSIDVILNWWADFSEGPHYYA